MKISQILHKLNEDLDEELIELINKTVDYYKSKYKVIGRGRNRIVFLKDKNTVFKVPLNLQGIEDNITENSRYVKYHKIEDIYAKTKMFYINDVNVLEMERVYPISYNDKIMPDWADYIDGRQVGKTKDGKIVAYDFA